VKSATHGIASKQARHCFQAGTATIGRRDWMVAGGYSRPLAVKNLPEPAAVSWTIGQWIFWSNDLPVELAGEGFEHAEHVGEFPGWEGQHPYGFRS
jgi:hypothetical protein